MASVDPQDIERVLMWHIERELTDEFQHQQSFCAACGHGLHEHVIPDSDADDTRLPWPCKFPMAMGAPAPLCHCNDYTTEKNDG